MGTISGCSHFKENLKAKLYIYVNSTIHRVVQQSRKSRGTVPLTFMFRDVKVNLIFFLPNLFQDVWPRGGPAVGAAHQCSEGSARQRH
jgi:hypothetical protein